jgi:hypothetical protein
MENGFRHVACAFRLMQPFGKRILVGWNPEAADR